MLRSLNICVLLITFSPIFYIIAPGASFVDDAFLVLIILICIPLVCANCLRLKVNGSWLLLGAYCTLCALIYDDKILTLLGLFYLFKFPLLVIVFLFLVPYGDHKKEFVFFFTTLVVCVSILNVLFFAAQGYLEGLGYDQMYGELPRNMGFFPNAQRNSYVICLALVGVTYFRGRVNWVTYAILSVANFLTFSKKAQAIHFLIFQGKVGWFYQGLLLFPVAILLGFMVIVEYEGLDLSSTIRGLLWLVPVQNFELREWVLGWGPGRWGGHVSTLIYSDLYYEYGLANLWGASSEHSTFLSDGYWPHVLGETGSLGVVVNLLMLYWVRNIIMRSCREDHVRGLMAVFYLLLIYSVFMSSFEVNIMLIPFAYLIALSVKSTGGVNEDRPNMSR